ncbi:hypothetical protein CRG98_040878 [Punica granatum]|uniref:Uncharacterized protein n=1 Tax=Punica granatum TaxID=22663 RepID=A0A2I0I440_PUNGR|nr:hypothetical protein CRG98_040878 [Punica granatum]
MASFIITRRKHAAAALFGIINTSRYDVEAWTENNSNLIIGRRLPGEVQWTEVLLPLPSEVYKVRELKMDIGDDDRFVVKISKVDANKLHLSLIAEAYAHKVLDQS